MSLSEHKYNINNKVLTEKLNSNLNYQSFVQQARSKLSICSNARTDPPFQIGKEKFNHLKKKTFIFLNCSIHQHRISTSFYLSHARKNRVSERTIIAGRRASHDIPDTLPRCQAWYINLEQFVRRER